MTTPTTKPRATVTITSDTEIVITRTFDAPARLVFAACTTPAYMAQWYGPRAMKLTTCEIDLRVGGRFQYVLQTPDGTSYQWKGVYREITPPDRWICTESFLLGDAWTADLVYHVTLVEHDGRTTLTNRVVYASRADRDGHLGAGMEDGMAESHERLDALLATMRG